jgi:hypothetical protein
LQGTYSNVYSQKLEPRAAIKESAPSCHIPKELEDIASTMYKFTLPTVNYIYNGVVGNMHDV